MLRSTLTGFCLCALAVPTATDLLADRNRGQEQARHAVKRGEARPLVEILARVRPQLGGELVGVSFERKSGRWVYEFKVIGAGGQLTEVYVDASTSDIVEREKH